MRPVIEERLTIVAEDQAATRGQFPSVVAGMFQTDDRGFIESTAYSPAL